MMSDTERRELYEEAVALMNKGDYESCARALKRFEEIAGYEDADELCTRCRELVDSADSFVDKVYSKRDKKKKIIKVVAIGLASLSAVLAVVHFVIMPRVSYNKAVDMYESGDYAGARDILENIGGYKDSSDYLAASSQKGELQVGDTFYLGRIEQDNIDPEDPIEWIILVKDGDNALVISKYIIHTQVFDDNQYVITWETSYLREWLSSYFYRHYLTDEERRCVQLVCNNPDINPIYEVETEQPYTLDKIFILSASEIIKYLPEVSDRIGYATPYAKYYQVAVNADTGSSYWWTRTYGSSEANMVVVDYNGDLNYAGSVKYSTRRGVRPAMWVDLTKVKELESITHE